MPSPDAFNFGTYQSPFTIRYGSPQMRKLHSQLYYFGGHRQVWSALAAAQEKHGILNAEELADIRARSGVDYVDVPRIRELDRRIKHDLMAHLKQYKEQAKVGGGKLHSGGTSMDVEDNVDIMRSRKSSDIVVTRVVNTVDSMRSFIEANADTPCVAWTHLQPAGYTTVGYRFANYAQDLLLALNNIRFVGSNFLKGKGMKGIAGTSSSYVELLGSPESAIAMEADVMSELGIEAFPVATQVYPRIADYLQLTSLATLAAAAHKFAFDLRLLSAPFLGELYKIPSKDKVGSSAAPWKVFNPTEAERMNSLSRYVSELPGIAWNNAGNTLLERTLDDSANRRIILSESYLATDQIMIEYDNILRNLGMRPGVIRRNLVNYGTFMNTEPLMMEAVKRGADRQRFHESVRGHMIPSYNQMLETGSVPLGDILAADEYVGGFFKPGEVAEFISVERGIDKELGTAPSATRSFLKNHIDPTLKRNRKRLGVHIEPEF